MEEEQEHTFINDLNANLGLDSEEEIKGSIKMEDKIVDIKDEILSNNDDMNLAHPLKVDFHLPYKPGQYPECASYVMSSEENHCISNVPQTDQNSIKMKDEIVDIREEILSNNDDLDIDLCVPETDNSTKEKSHTCNICERTFPHIGNLKNHMLIHTGEKRNDQLKKDLLSHGEVKKHQCNICEKYFIQRSSLTIHQVLHTGEKNYKCEMCEKSFSRNDTLKKHMMIHIGEKKYRCYICEKLFLHNSALKRHLNIHQKNSEFSSLNGNSNKCAICEKSFSTSYRLTKHLVKHVLPEDIKCDICEKKFTQRHSLKEHMILHTQEKHYTCEFCEKCFSRKDTLKKHLMIHIGEKKYKCDKCNKSFLHDSALKRHSLVHQRKEIVMH